MLPSILDHLGDVGPVRRGERVLLWSSVAKKVRRMRTMLRTVGSLKLAVVLLVALAVAMSLASLHEAQHGTEAALRDYYRSRWFAAILAAVGVNALASLLIRWPFRRRQIGFVVAHVSVLIILVGAWITRVYAVDGRLWLRPQETRTDFDGDAWVLSLQTADGKQYASVPVNADGPAFDPAEADQRIGSVSWTIEKFAVDTRDEGERIVPDPNAPWSALKIRLTHGQHQHDQWLLTDRQEIIGDVRIRFLRLTDPDVLSRVLQPTSSPAQPKRGKLVVELNGRSYAIDLDTQADQPVPLGQTGYQIRIGRYLPHAQVSGREIRSATSRPVNPMIEFDLIDPAGKAEPHRFFARFPGRDFATPHGGTTAPTSHPTSQPVRFRYVDATVLAHQRNRIDLLVDGSDKLHARFTDADGRITSAALELNRPTATPWQETQLTALEFVPHARNERALTPIPRRIKHAIPAAFVCLRTAATAHRLWVRRGERYDVHIGGQHVQVGYVPVSIPMGFSVKLLEPVITHYPGSDRPRTYESRVLVEDPNRGVELEQTISMHAPLKYGGRAFYQSSYHFDQNNEPVATMLSVVSDPGELVVYVGYVGLTVGLLVVLAQQVRRRSRARLAGASA